MRVTLTSNILGVGEAGLTVDDVRGEEWIVRGLAKALGVEKAEVVEKSEPLAPPAPPPPAPSPEPKVPDFFAPEPPAEAKPHKRRRHHE